LACWNKLDLVLRPLPLSLESQLIEMEGVKTPAGREAPGMEINISILNLTRVCLLTEHVNYLLS